MAQRTAQRTAIVRAVPVRTAAPIIRVTTPRAATTKKKSKGRRHHAHASAHVNQKTIMAAAIGGAVLGFVDKSFPTLPTLPYIGRAGTIAIAAWALSGRSGIGHIARDVALAAAAVAGYELASTGKVSGGDIAPQVGGLASQV